MILAMTGFGGSKVFSWYSSSSSIRRYTHWKPTCILNFNSVIIDGYLDNDNFIPPVHVTVSVNDTIAYFFHLQHSMRVLQMKRGMAKVQSARLVKKLPDGSHETVR